MKLYIPILGVHLTTIEKIIYKSCFYSVLYMYMELQNTLFWYWPFALFQWQTPRPPHYNGMSELLSNPENLIIIWAEHQMIILLSWFTSHSSGVQAHWLGDVFVIKWQIQAIMSPLEANVGSSLFQAQKYIICICNIWICGFISNISTMHIATLIPIYRDVTVFCLIKNLLFSDSTHDYYSTLISFE